jgi:hypothetical protein
MNIHLIKRTAAHLEVGAVGLALLALAYRATLYWQIAVTEGQAPSTRDLLDFALAMLLFLVCGLCATAGVAINFMGERSDRPLAYRAFFVGVVTFLLYDILHPHVPRLL